MFTVTTMLLSRYCARWRARLPQHAGGQTVTKPDGFRPLTGRQGVAGGGFRGERDGAAGS